IKLEAVFGGRSVGTPGVLAMLKMAHDAHGVLPWAEVFEPAIRIAEQGFIVSPRLEEYITKDTLLMKIPASRDHFYDENGDPWKAGHLLKNPKHAAVLRRIANEGIDAFYKGDIAEKIVDAVRNAPFNPGLLTLSDLENYTAKERDVLCGPFREYKVCSISSPSSGGSTTIAALGMLKEYDLGEMKPHSAEAYHLMLESERLAYADRDQFSADSDFVYVPIHGMINQDYLAERAKMIDPLKSMGKAEHGNPPTDRDAPLELAADQSLEIPSTTHFVILDKWGHAVSMTATVESMFGSRVMVEGFMLNNELTDFSLVPEVDGRLVNNRVQGGKRPRSTMSPSITFDADNRPVLVVGSPGGSNIIDYVTQTIINVLDWDMNIQDAINQPHVLNKNGPTLVEEGTSAESLIEPLRALGHEVNAVTLMSGLHGIRIKYPRENQRTLEGGADPRREGYVAQ
ncbi:MAG: gamma-glutamyltransferase family protein, partial [Kordiimonadaceae bacterium]|nr:gamma-glutamyltransferase family protein [Kordiimonadaceae bacterium]